MDRTWRPGRSPRSEPLASVVVRLEEQATTEGRRDIAKRRLLRWLRRQPDQRAEERPEWRARSLLGPRGRPATGLSRRGCSCAATLDELRRAGDDRIDAATGVAYHEWPESPGSTTARQPIRDAHRGNGATARCDRSRAAWSKLPSVHLRTAI